MVDEFPEGTPGEQVKLKCTQGEVPLPAVGEVDLSTAEEELTFGTVAEDWICDAVLKSVRKKYEDAKLALLAKTKERLTREKSFTVKAQLRKAKVKHKLRHKAGTKAMKEFIGEARHRAGEGYSVQQLIKSHIPEFGREVQVTEHEIRQELAIRVILFMLFPWWLVFVSRLCLSL